MISARLSLSADNFFADVFPPALRRYLCSLGRMFGSCRSLAVSVCIAAAQTQFHRMRRNANHNHKRGAFSTTSEGGTHFFRCFSARETIGVPFASLDSGDQEIIDFVVL